MAFTEFQVNVCTYNVFKPDSSDLEVSRECASYASFVEFLGAHIKGKKTAEKQHEKQQEPKKRSNEHYICEQVAQVDMIRLLECTLNKLLELPNTNHMSTLSSLRKDIGAIQEPLFVSVRQPFIVTSDSKKVCSVDSASPLDPFRLKRNLKGKKVPNEKKNVDAQLFENKEQAYHCLEETKHFFNYMAQPVQPVSLNLDSMMRSRTRVPNMRQVVFLLLCAPQTVLSSLTNNQQQEAHAHRGVSSATSKKRRKLNNDQREEPSANDIRQGSYINTVYQNIPKKKKIYKTPSIGSVMFADGSIIMSSARFINWFNSKMTAISN